METIEVDVNEFMRYRRDILACTINVKLKNISGFKFRIKLACMLIELAGKVAGMNVEIENYNG